MSTKSTQAKKSPVVLPAQAVAAIAAPNRWQIPLLLLALGTAILCVAVIWAYPRPIGDLYVGLAGGRDVMQHKMGHPDDWSFLTTDHVWMDQNWGTHLAYYWANRLGGQTGLLVLKAIMITLMGLGVTMAGRRRGASTAVSIFVAGGVIIASKAYIDLRPNLSTLMMAPWMLYLLLITRGHDKRIWIAVAFTTLWANMHGGFNLGLGMMGLWAACHIFCTWGPRGFEAAIKAHWQLAAATAAAIVLAGVVAPFVVVKPYGLANLTHGFIVFNNELWRNVNEWLPIWAGQWYGYGSLWEFLIVIGTAGIAAFAHFIVWNRRRLAKGQPKLQVTAAGVAYVLFEAGLMLVVLYMACSARRFMPPAMALVAPFLAAQLQWLLRPAQKAWPLAVVCLAVALPTAWLGHKLWNPAGLWNPKAPYFYSPRSPMAAEESMLDRMILASSIVPTNAVQFINDNKDQYPLLATGRIFQEWRWEGYTHWMCPQLKLYIGGRAQQVYTVEQYSQMLYFLGNPPQDIQMLKDMDVHLMLVPWGDSIRTITAICFSPNSTWSVIYYDDHGVVAADGAYPASQKLVEAAALGTLKYPSEKIAALSRAVALVSTPNLNRLSAAEMNDLLRNTLSKNPSPLMVQLIVGRMAHVGQADAAFLEQQYAQVSSLEEPRANGAIYMSTCQALADALAGVYNDQGRLAESRMWEERAKAIRREVEDIQPRWAPK